MSEQHPRLFRPKWRHGSQKSWKWFGFRGENILCQSNFRSNGHKLYLLVMDHREFNMSVVFVWWPCKQLTHGLSFIERTLQFLPESTVLVIGQRRPFHFLVIIFSLLSNADDPAAFPHQTGNSGGLQKHVFVCLVVIEGSFPVLPCLRRLISCWSHSFEKGSWRFTLCDSVVADAHACIYTFTHTQTETLSDYYCNHEGICKHAQYLA